MVSPSGMLSMPCSWAEAVGMRPEARKNTSVAAAVVVVVKEGDRDSRGAGVAILVRSGDMVQVCLVCVQRSLGGRRRV